MTLTSVFVSLTRNRKAKKAKKAKNAINIAKIKEKRQKNIQILEEKGNKINRMRDTGVVRLAGSL